MPNIAKLRAEHDELLRIARRLGRLVALPSPPTYLDLFDVRREFASLLVAHLKSEDWVLYPRLLASEDRHIAGTARRFIDELGYIADAYAQHAHRWTAFTIAADWTGYCRAAAALIGTLENRIELENRDLYPLLQKMDEAA